MKRDPVGYHEFPHLNVIMLGCLSLRRCLISVSLMSRTFFTATSSPWNLPRKTAPCAPLPTHCRSEISSKGTSQDSKRRPTCQQKQTQWIHEALHWIFFSSTLRVITLNISITHCKASKCQYVLLPGWTGRSQEVCWANARSLLHIRMGWQDTITSYKAPVMFKQMAYWQLIQETITFLSRDKNIEAKTAIHS